MAVSMVSVRPSGVPDRDRVRESPATYEPAKTPVAGPQILRLRAAGTGCNVSRMHDSLDAWFKREILPHEPALMRYLARVWPRKEEVPDLRQETYARVYEAALASRPTSPRS